MLVIKTEILPNHLVKRCFPHPCADPATLSPHLGSSWPFPAAKGLCLAQPPADLGLFQLVTALPIRHKLFRYHLQYQLRVPIRCFNVCIWAEEEQLTHGENEAWDSTSFSAIFQLCALQRLPSPPASQHLTCRLGVRRVKEPFGQLGAWATKNVSCFLLHGGTQDMTLGVGRYTCCDIPLKCPLPRTASLLRELVHIHS